MEWSAVGAHAHAHPNFVPFSFSHAVPDKDLNKYSISHPFENWDSKHNFFKLGYAIADSVEHRIGQRNCIRDSLRSWGVTVVQPSPALCVAVSDSLPVTNLDADVYGSCAIKNLFPDAHLNANVNADTVIDHRYKSLVIVFSSAVCRRCELDAYASAPRR